MGEAGTTHGHKTQSVFLQQDKLYNVMMRYIKHALSKFENWLTEVSTHKTADLLFQIHLGCKPQWLKVNSNIFLRNYTVNS